MEKANPFPTGFGFARKSKLYVALNYELDMNFLVSDCNTFNYFIFFFCASSILCKIIEFALDSVVLYTAFMNTTGLVI